LAGSPIYVSNIDLFVARRQEESFFRRRPFCMGDFAAWSGYINADANILGRFP
jgi:hypothetical protein